MSIVLRHGRHTAFNIKPHESTGYTATLSYRHSSLTTLSQITDLWSLSCLDDRTGRWPSLYPPPSIIYLWTLSNVYDTNESIIFSIVCRLISTVRNCRRHFVHNEVFYLWTIKYWCCTKFLDNKLLISRWNE